MSALSKSFFDHLESVSGFSFPVTCPECKRTFSDIHDLLTNTEPFDEISDVHEGYDSEHHRIFELLRSCKCGASLLEEFVSRRDESAEGLAKRMEFSRLLQDLRKAGVSKDEACEELRSVLNGVESELIETLGLSFKND